MIDGYLIERKGRTRKSFRPLEEVKKELEQEKKEQEQKEKEEKEYIASQPF